MPLYRYTDPVVSRTYPETRDALGRHLGTVEPGAEREFEQAPDQWWVLADPGGDGDRDGKGDGTGQDQAPGTEGDAGDLPAETPPGPVPAPPAVIPGT